MPNLKIAADLALPVDAVTEPIGIFANRGKGKSNVAHRFVEELYHAGLPSIVLDIKGDWFGIRSSADGTGPGLPFIIFGGAHGDVPLEPGSGADVARFLAEHRVPSVVDLSQLSKTAARRWTMEFAEELYRVNTEPLMVVVDEADVLIPQRLSADLMRLLGAMEDIAKRGRQRGLGITVISQRVADVNKAVTDLLETLFLLAVTGTRTRKAIGEWIDDHADVDEAKAVVATLSSLEPGEGWVWSPGFLRLLRRVRFLRPTTFDSHATPKAGEKRRSIKTLADVDLSAITAAMADTIEKAKADDPKELRAELARLRDQVRRLENQPASTVVERVEVPVLSEDLVIRLEEALQPVAAVLAEVQDRLTWQTTQEGEMVAFERRLADRPTGPPERTAPRTAERTEPAAKPPKPQVTAPRRGDSSGDTTLTDAKREILTALAQHGGTWTGEQLAVLVGKSYSGGFRNYLAALRSADYIAGPNKGPIYITEPGVEALGEWEPLPTGRALLQHWLDGNKLTDAAKDVLRAVAANPGLDGPGLAAECGKEYSGGFRNYLSKLRTLRVIEGPNAGPIHIASALED